MEYFLFHGLVARCLPFIDSVDVIWYVGSKTGSENKIKNISKNVTMEAVYK